MADSSDIDAALVQKLASDATLLGHALNGVYVDEAPPGATTFVIVSLISALDAQKFGGRAYEDALYLVKFVALSTAAANVKAAAARIDALLEGQPLTVAGYTLMTMHREERMRLTEVDEVDTSIRWHHRGGRYRVMVSPGT